MSEDIYFNRRVNYLIIERVWKLKNKNKPIELLYQKIDINRNDYSKIRTDSEIPVNLNTKWDKYNLANTGLSMEIMTGEQMIEMEGISKQDWKQYIETRYSEDKNNNDRQKSMAKFRRRLNNIIEKIQVDKNDKSDIGKLIYFCTYGEKSDSGNITDKEMYNLNRSLLNISVDMMKLCNKELRKEVLENLKKVYKKLNIIVQYDELGN